MKLKLDNVLLGNISEENLNIHNSIIDKCLKNENSDISIDSYNFQSKFEISLSSSRTMFLTDVRNVKSLRNKKASMSPIYLKTNSCGEILGLIRYYKIVN